MASVKNINIDSNHNEAAWRIAVGLAKASDLDTFEYMIKVAPRVYEELISADENFSADAFLKLNKRVNTGVSTSAGKIRNVNLKNKLLADLNQALDFDFDEIQIDALLEHFAKFLSRLWKNKYLTHGNTVTCAVFFIKYLQLLGFDFLNAKPFEQSSAYFRAALEKSDTRALTMFLANFIFGKNNKLIEPKFIRPNKTEDAVIKAIKANPDITQEELAKMVGKSVRTVKTITKSLSDNGRITRLNGKRFGHWVVL